MVRQNKSATSKQKQEEHKAAFGWEPREVFQPVDEQIEYNPQHGAHQHALNQAVEVVLPREALDFLYQFVWCRHLHIRLICKNSEFPRKRRNYSRFWATKKEFRFRNSFAGATCRTRTNDLRITNALLYQLS